MKNEIFLKCEAAQSELRCEGQPAELQLDIEAQDPNAKGPPPLPKFSMAAYNGGPMRVSGWRYPVVVDLAGMSIPAQSIPIRLQHDPMHGVGHTTQIDMNQNTKITAKGLISRSTPAALEVADSGKKGHPWQASIGAAVHEHEWVPEDKSVQVNGRSIKGPVNVIRKSTLNEISFVDLGADTTSSANVAASAANNLEQQTMNPFEKWLEAHGHDKAKLSAEKLKELQAQFDAEVAKTKADEEARKIAAAGGGGNDEVAKMRAASAAEMKRIAAVKKICVKDDELAAQAIEAGWDESKTELEQMRKERAEWTKKAPNAIIAGTADKIEDGVLECAMFQSTREIGDAEATKQYGEKTMEAARKRFKGQLSLKLLLLEAAWAAGANLRTFEGNHREVLKAAFSTLSLPGILSNFMNKILLDSFNAVEQAWRDIAAIRSVRDFKLAHSYRLGGSMEYDEVGPHGELKSGLPSEVSYTNQAKTYGKILSISRQDIINDDLGALASVPRRLGRGAGLKLNKVFWTKFLSLINANSFFVSGNNNYFSGGNSALSLVSGQGLDQAATAFRNQTDPDGEPLGYEPRILLVPNALATLAMQLMRSMELRDTTASQKYGTDNPFAGRYKPVVSAYISNSKITGNTTTGWGLLCDPRDLAAIEVAFLNGQESPIVETTEADFDTLGIRSRGYHDWGCEAQEFRAGVWSAGA